MYRDAAVYRCAADRPKDSASWHVVSVGRFDFAGRAKRIRFGDDPMLPREYMMRWWGRYENTVGRQPRVFGNAPDVEQRCLEHVGVVGR